MYMYKYDSPVIRKNSVFHSTHSLQAYSENQLLCTSTTTTAHCRMIFISATCKEKCAQD